MMEKTIKINLGGELFQIDEEAYNILKKYLQDIDSRLGHTQGGAETLEDIELRIAEIFHSQGGQAGVITKENVDAMISIIGSPETFETSGETRETGHPVYTANQRKRMYRNPDDTIIGGVCSGIGEYIDIDPVWIRLLFILFTFFFGIGFLVYVALWISLPAARSDSQKREMYGERYYSRNGKGSGGSDSAPGTGSVHSASSNVGNAFNEVFRAIGKVCFVIARVFLILIGICLVICGFLSLISVIMVFFFKYPDYFSTHSFGVNLFYLSDFLNYLVNPAITPWILFLGFIVLLMPLLAMIYWGVKMIFWFRARDGIVSLIALVIWIGSIAALSLILFNEGISYSETAKSVTSEVVLLSHQDLYILSGHKVSELSYDKELTFDDDYNIYFTNNNRNLSVSTRLNINESENNSSDLNIKKRSMGKNRMDAERKAEGLLYNYKISGDTIFLDEYFTIPSGTKYSFDNVSVNLFVPQGTKIHFDKTTENMFRYHHFNDSDRDRFSDSDNKYEKSPADDFQWVMTEDGLRRESLSSGKTR